MLDEVISTLIDRVPDYTDARAAGWRPVQLPQKLYPGLIANVEYHASGRLYRGLTANEWTVLDSFEDPTYHLVPVQVVPESHQALAYVWPGPFLSLTWNIDALSSDEVRSYIQRCAAWRTRYESA